MSLFKSLPAAKPQLQLLPNLPQEICDRVLDFIDMGTLVESASLVNREWTEKSSRNLYKNITSLSMLKRANVHLHHAAATATNSNRFKHIHYGKLVKTLFKRPDLGAQVESLHLTALEGMKLTAPATALEQSGEIINLNNNPPSIMNSSSNHYKRNMTAQILSRTPNLKHLSLVSNTRDWAEYIPHEHLESLHLAIYGESDPESVMGLFERMIRVGKLKSVAIAAGAHLLPSYCLEVLAQCPLLEHVSLVDTSGDADAGGSGPGEAGGILNACLSKLAENPELGNLKSLSLVDNVNNKSNSSQLLLENILPRLVQLKSLRLYGSGILENRLETIQDISRIILCYCPRIESLELEGSLMELLTSVGDSSILSLLPLKTRVGAAVDATKTNPPIQVPTAALMTPQTDYHDSSLQLSTSIASKRTQNGLMRKSFDVESYKRAPPALNLQLMASHSVADHQFQPEKELEYLAF